MNKKNLGRNGEKGITLVALIITIIVLLILAVVAIRAVQGDGIIQHAKNSRDEYEQAQTNEQTTLEGYLETIESNLPNGSGAGNVAYTIGQEVMVGTEKFYVIKDSDATQDEVTLLAKDCIDTTTKKQSSSAGTVAFSKTNYWSSEFTSSPYNLTETGEPDSSHYAAKAAYDYGVEVGGKGRLMTYSEAEALQSANSDILYGKNGKSSSSSLYYWLGSAYDSRYVWNVNGSALTYDDFTGYDCICGIRPVVKILKSKVSIAP